MVFSGCLVQVLFLFSRTPSFLAGTTLTSEPYIFHAPTTQANNRLQEYENVYLLYLREIRDCLKSTGFIHFPELCKARNDSTRRGEVRKV